MKIIIPATKYIPDNFIVRKRHLAHFYSSRSTKFLSKRRLSLPFECPHFSLLIHNKDTDASTADVLSDYSPRKFKTFHKLNIKIIQTYTASIKNANDLSYDRIKFL